MSDSEPTEPNSLSNFTSNFTEQLAEVKVWQRMMEVEMDVLREDVRILKEQASLSRSPVGSFSEGFSFEPLNDPLNEPLIEPLKGGAEIELAEWSAAAAPVTTEAAKLAPSRRSKVSFKNTVDITESTGTAITDTATTDTAITSTRTSFFQGRASMSFRAKQAKKKNLLHSALQSLESSPFELKMGWQAALLIGLPETGWVGSASLAFSVFVATILQLLYCFILHHTFVTEKLPSVDAMRRWRNSDGHDATKMNVILQKSLVKQVCDLDEAASYGLKQMDTVSTIKNYLHAHAGIVVELMTQVGLFFTVIQYTYNAAEFLTAIAEVPRGRYTSMAGNSNKFVLAVMGYCRFACMVVLTTAHVFISLLLLILAAIWMANEKKLADMIRLVTIAFVMNFDQLIVGVVATLRTRAILANLKPFPRTRFVSIKMLRWKPFVTVFAQLSFLSFMLVVYLWPQELDMQEVLEAACGGDQDFVVEIQHSTGRLLDVHLTANENLSISQLATEELRNRTVKKNERKSVQLQNLESLRALASVDIESYSLTWPHCDDTLQLPKGWETTFTLPSLMAVRQYTGIFEGTNCSDFKDHCDDAGYPFVRLKCAHTCGCHNPYSGQVFDIPMQGCPQKECRHVKQSYLDKKPCDNLSPSTLKKNKGWRRLVLTLNKTEFAMFNRQQRDVHVGRLWDHGCSEVGRSARFYQVGLWMSSLCPYCPLSCKSFWTNPDGSFYIPKAQSFRTWISVSTQCNVDLKYQVPYDKETPCKDRRRNELSGPPWVNIVEKYRTAFKRKNIDDPAFERNLLQRGCDEVRRDFDRYCSGRKFPTMRVFCPIACRCDEPQHFALPCPEKCAYFDPSSEPMTDDVVISESTHDDDGDEDVSDSDTTDELS